MKVEFVENTAHWKRAAFQWAASFSPLCFLDSNEYPSRHGTYECLIGAGALRSLRHPEAPTAFSQLREFYQSQPSWLFGHLAYDLKNDLENLSSQNPDGVGFPALHFFQPLVVLELFPSGELRIHSEQKDPEQIFREIQNQTLAPETAAPPIHVRARMAPSEYLEKVRRLQEHILEGDIYEVNFCQEFFAENCDLDTQALFWRLNQLAKAPFSAYYQTEENVLLCASPERFLKKTGNRLLSQPIKGTIHRGRDAEEDARLREQLAHSPKDRAENVMIVDLVRNDLARTCKPGSVRVPELFGIYPFAQVFQMISTVEGELREGMSFIEAIQKAFPMGSMTGAPKVMSMQLIEQYENSRRGLYSGALGYITPQGDFDFNVVIRSLLYNSDSRYLSFQVGGAIVYDSIPESEYEECQWKARALLNALKGK